MSGVIAGVATLVASLAFYHTYDDGRFGVSTDDTLLLTNALIGVVVSGLVGLLTLVEWVNHRRRGLPPEQVEE